jgi:hypothetical protein
MICAKNREPFKNCLNFRKSEVWRLLAFLCRPNFPSDLKTGIGGLAQGLTFPLQELYAQQSLRSQPHKSTPRLQYYFLGQRLYQISYATDRKTKIWCKCLSGDRATMARSASPPLHRQGFDRGVSNTNGNKCVHWEETQYFLTEAHIQQMGSRLLIFQTTFRLPWEPRIWDGNPKAVHIRHFGETGAG